MDTHASVTVALWRLFPTEMAETVKLTSSDGKEFVIPAKVAKISKTLKSMLDGLITHSSHGND
jgi:hypothetical protein